MKFLPALLLSVVCISTATADIAVEILEGVPDNRKWDLSQAHVTDEYTEPAFAFVDVPTRYSPKGHALDRSFFVLRATAKFALPAGEYQFLVRARSAARLYMDGKIIVEIPFPSVVQNGHNAVKPIPAMGEGLNPLEPGQADKMLKLKLDGKEHEFRFEAVAGSRKTRAELGNPVVAIAAKNGPFQLLSAQPSVAFDRKGWDGFVAEAGRRQEKRDTETRLRVSADERAYWQKRHEIVRTLAKERPAPAAPKVADDDTIRNDIDRFVAARLQKLGIKPNALASDLVFLRRVALDTIGTIPSRQMMLSFLANKSPERRAQIIDQLLEDASWADHWVSFWQDLLAENPGILKPVLNNSGPFRWWLYWAMRDNLPLDRFATDLIMMEGGVMAGAPAAFSVATENDSPMAARAHVLAKAFLAVDMTCARCHDAPFHPYKQQQLFGMAAMLGRNTLKIPATSSVPQVEGGRKPFVKVSLPAGSQVKAEWQFTDFAPLDVPAGFVRKADDSRERLAAIVTSPHNTRFAKVLVNRVWQRFLGAGLVDNMDDWGEEASTSHPELLDYLAHELITHDYDLKHLSRLILNSHTYQRDALEKTALLKDRSFAGPARRRMTAEQLVDSLYVAAGKEFDSEELTFDPECWQTAKTCGSLGRPTRSWQFTSLSNERDRPALALPIAQGYIDLLTAFGWRDARPDPLSVRDDSLTALHTMTLANGQLMHRLVRLTDEGAITELSLEKQPLEVLVEKVYQRVLSRTPTKDELVLAVDLLREGYDQRLTGSRPAPKPVTPRSASWSYHLRPEATRMQMEAEQAARVGDPPTPRLSAAWRMRMEDLLWSLLNSPEFVFVP